MALFSRKKDNSKTDDAQLKEEVLAMPKSAVASKKVATQMKVQKPLISEKAIRLSENNTYVFLIHPKANKSEIKKEIERIYNVEVVKVNTAKVRKEPKMFRGIRSSKDPVVIKKAMVTVKDGQKIEILNK